MALTKDNTAVLFKNKDKTKDTAPDYKGSAKVAGKDYDFAAWINEATDKEGKPYKYMSCKFSEPFKKPEQAAKPGPVADMDDQEIPF